MAICESVLRQYLICLEGTDCPHGPLPPIRKVLEHPTGPRMGFDAYNLRGCTNSARFSESHLNICYRTYIPGICLPQQPVLSLTLLNEKSGKSFAYCMVMLSVMQMLCCEDLLTKSSQGPAAPSECCSKCCCLHADAIEVSTAPARPSPLPCKDLAQVLRL